MNFLDALRTKRPMRRAEWVCEWPREPLDRWDYRIGWVLLGHDGDPPPQYRDGKRQYPWIQIVDGRRRWLSEEDYLAEDWEVMA